MAKFFERKGKQRVLDEQRWSDADRLDEERELEIREMDVRLRRVEEFVDIYKEVFVKAKENSAT